MHAVHVRVTVADRETAVKALQDQIVPAVSGAPGFVAGYWVALPNGKGTSIVVFDSEASAQAACRTARSAARRRDNRQRRSRGGRGARLASRRLPLGLVLVVADKLLERDAGDFTERPATLPTVGFRLPAQVGRYSNGDRW